MLDVRRKKKLLKTFTNNHKNIFVIPFISFFSFYNLTIGHRIFIRENKNFRIFFVFGLRKKLHDRIDMKRNEGKHHGAISSGVLELKSRILLINNVVMGVRVEKIAGKCAGTEKAALFTPAGWR